MSARYAARHVARHAIHAIMAAALAGLIALDASLHLAMAQPQGYPSRPIRIIVPTGPGGGFDIQARTIAQKLSEKPGLSVIVENRPGAGSLNGTDAVAKAPADGYTLLYGGLTNMAANVGLYKKLPYDPVADFTTVAKTVFIPFCLIARKDLPQTSLQQLLEFGRGNAGKINYASAGVGTGQHVAAAVMFKLANVDAVHVPYKAAAPAVQDVIASRVDVLFDNCGPAKQYVDAGQVRLLAVSSRERNAAFPGVPTAIESGVANMEMDSWAGLYAHSATPAPILEWLRKEVAVALTAPDVVARLERGGGRVSKMSTSEADAFVRSEVAKWRALIPQAGITAD